MTTTETLGTVVVRLLRLCGGTPAAPSRWLEEGNLMRVQPADVRAAEPNVWGVPCYVGVVPCRRATAEETARLRAAETAGRDPRPASLWRGRPIPPAPRLRADER